MISFARHSVFATILSICSGLLSGMAFYSTLLYAPRYKGKSFGKAWQELDVERPGPPEDEQDQQ